MLPPRGFFCAAACNDAGLWRPHQTSTSMVDSRGDALLEAQTAPALGIFSEAQVEVREKRVMRKGAFRGVSGRGKAWVWPLTAVVGGVVRSGIFNVKAPSWSPRMGSATRRRV